jgi:4-hydroxybenzoate polyprenyltransferase
VIQYFRLLRFQDQYIQVATALFGGILAQNTSPQVLWWVFSVTLISCATFIVNELTDRKDTDKASWNPVHAHTKDRLNRRFVLYLFWGVSFVGLLIAYTLGMFWWAIAMWLIGVGYSVKPVRLKARFGWDIAAQLLVWWIIPFMGMAWRGVPYEIVVPMVAILSAISWSVFYPYQIADYKADKKAKLKSTHVVLGVRESAAGGLILGVVGTVLFFVFGFHRMYPVLLPLLGFQMFALGRYIRWLNTVTEKQMLTGMQRYVRLVKPLGSLFPFYFFLVWRIMYS